MQNVAVIVTSAGTSSRLDLGVKKEFLPLKNGTVLSESVKTFLELDECRILVITFLKGTLEETKKALYSDSGVYKKLNQKISSGKLVLNFTEGDETRQKSVFKGLESIDKIIKSENFLECEKALDEWQVLIHDGARPFVDFETILKTVEAVKEFGSAVPGLKATDSVVKINSEGFIEKSIDRSSLNFVQTPQGFVFGKLLSAYKKSLNDGNIYTDDTSVWQAYVQNAKTKVVEGNLKNIKITYKDDLRNF